MVVVVVVVVGGGATVRLPVVNESAMHLLPHVPGVIKVRTSHCVPRGQARQAEATGRNTVYLEGLRCTMMKCTNVALSCVTSKQTNFNKRWSIGSYSRRERLMTITQTNFNKRWSII